MFIARLLNCFMSGAEFTTNPDGSRIRNRIPLTIGGFEADLLQQENGVLANAYDHAGEAIHTTTLHIPSAAPADLNTCQELARAVAQLLMFATASEVRYYEFVLPGADPSGVRWSVVGTTLSSVPVLELVDGANTKRYLETTYPNYMSQRDPRDLNVAIEYSVLAQKSGLPYEVKGAITFILLEQLKHTFARVDGYPFIDGFYREKSATATKPGGTVPFKRLLTEMFAAVGMAPVLEPAIKLRNELIHSGSTGLSVDDLIKTKAAALDLAREYLLRVLGYTGPYVPFSSPNALLSL